MDLNIEKPKTYTIYPEAVKKLLDNIKTVSGFNSDSMEENPDGLNTPKTIDYIKNIQKMLLAEFINMSDDEKDQVNKWLTKQDNDKLHSLAFWIGFLRGVETYKQIAATII